ncbi:MAG: hypothetical protein LQ348_003363 [Seirophora lacunosa]|nr:MAG: hypothetical protein LQ348_003363 [Seirophora lacunosa]
MNKDSSSVTNRVHPPTTIAVERQVRAESGDCWTLISAPYENPLVHREYEAPIQSQAVALKPVEGAWGTETVNKPKEGTLLAVILPFLLVPSVIGIFVWLKHRQKRQATEHPGHELGNVTMTDSARTENNATATATANAPAGNAAFIANDASAGYELDGRKTDDNAEGTGAGYRSMFGDNSNASKIMDAADGIGHASNTMSVPRDNHVLTGRMPGQFLIEERSSIAETKAGGVTIFGGDQ